MRGALAAFVVAAGSVSAAAGLLGIRPSTAKRHLADLRARSGLTTEQLIYTGRAAGWLIVPALEPNCHRACRTRAPTVRTRRYRRKADRRRSTSSGSCRTRANSSRARERSTRFWPDCGRNDSLQRGGGSRMLDHRVAITDSPLPADRPSARSAGSGHASAIPSTHCWSGRTKKEPRAPRRANTRALRSTGRLADPACRTARPTRWAWASHRGIPAR